jgi:hypothetical protein
MITDSSQENQKFQHQPRVQPESLHQYFGGLNRQAVGGPTDPLMDATGSSNYITVKENFKANPDSPEVFFRPPKTQLVSRQFQ